MLPARAREHPFEIIHVHKPTRVWSIFANNGYLCLHTPLYIIIRAFLLHSVTDIRRIFLFHLGWVCHVTHPVPLCQEISSGPSPSSPLFEGWKGPAFGRSHRTNTRTYMPVYTHTRVGSAHRYPGAASTLASFGGPDTRVPPLSPVIAQTPVPIRKKVPDTPRVGTLRQPLSSLGRQTGKTLCLSR